jgi:ATP-dependent helicase HrpB
VAAVLFDEFHERSLHADLGLALCREAQESLGLPLRLLVMSATIDASAVASRLGDAPVIEAQGRTYPVTVHYLGRALPILPEQRTLSGRELAPVVQHIRRVLEQTAGDVLVFLPGSPEIHRLREQMEDLRNQAIDIHALYRPTQSPQTDPGHQHCRDLAHHRWCVRGDRLWSRAPLAVRSGYGHGAPDDGAHLAGLGHTARRPRRSHGARQCVAVVGRGCASQPCAADAA